MSTATRNLTRRTASALTTLLLSLTPDAVFHLLNGYQIQRWLDSGDLVTVEDWLNAHGADARLLDGHRSWTGRHVAAAYRAAHPGQRPARAWVRHRTTRRWIRVFVYHRADPALPLGAATYPRTCHLVPADTLPRR